MTHTITKPNELIPPLENGDKLTRLEKEGGQSTISEDRYIFNPTYSFRRTTMLKNHHHLSSLHPPQRNADANHQAKQQ